MRSVLRFSDQAEGRFPDRCVLTGRPTTSAIRLRAVPTAVPEVVADAASGLLRLGRPVALPVHPAAMSDYRRGQSRWVGVGGAGLGLVVAGILGGQLPWAGAVLIVLAVAGSARFRRRRWVQVRRRDAAEVVVLRTHPEFDRQARELYASSVGRGE